MVLVVKPKPARVECVGPGCRTIISLKSAQAESWIVYPKMAVLPHSPERRDYLGWCRACKERYGVIE
jgi:hypothetical protein